MDRRKGVTRKDMAGRFDLEEFELASRPRCVSLTYHQQSHMMYDATGRVSQLECPCRHWSRIKTLDKR